MEYHGFERIYVERENRYGVEVIQILQDCFVLVKPRQALSEQYPIRGQLVIVSHSEFGRVCGWRD